MSGRIKALIKHIYTNKNPFPTGRKYPHVCNITTLNLGKTISIDITCYIYKLIFKTFLHTMNVETITCKLCQSIMKLV